MGQKTDDQMQKTRRELRVGIHFRCCSCELHPSGKFSVFKASTAGKFGGWGAVSGFKWGEEGLERQEFSGFSAAAAGR